MGVLSVPDEVSRTGTMPADGEQGYARRHATILLAAYAISEAWSTPIGTFVTGISKDGDGVSPSRL